MPASLSIPQIAEQTSPTLQAIASPARLAILLVIGRGEACVCHLEAVLGWRQAYLSQHLMALRKAEVLQDRREGRYIYYRLKEEGILTLLRDAATLSGIPAPSVEALLSPQPSPVCECPVCSPGNIPLAGK